MSEKPLGLSRISKTKSNLTLYNFLQFGVLLPNAQMELSLIFFTLQLLYMV